MNHVNVLVGEFQIGIDFLNRWIVPARDLAKEDVSQNLRGELQIFFNSGNVVSRYYRTHYRWNELNRRLRLLHLLISHAHVTGAEINGSSDDLANAAAAANRLIVDLNLRVLLVVLAKPLGINRIWKCSACSVQSRLGCRRTDQQRCNCKGPLKTSHWRFAPSMGT